MVYQTSRAKVLYEQDPSTISEDVNLDEDDELVLTPANELDEGDELPDLDGLPEEPEEEEDEFVEGSPRFEQFRSDFTKAFGLPLEDARDLVQGLQAESIKRSLNEQKYELSAAWDVPVTEVDRRLMVVKTMWDKLPSDKQQAYDSTKGAQALYARYEQQQQRKGATKAAKTSTKGASSSSGSQSKYWYSESQINSMDAATYAQNANRIMVAYAQGRVKR